MNIVPTPSSIVLISSEANSDRILIGSGITFTCTVALNPAILGSEIFLLTVDVQLSRDGTPLTLTGPIVTGTTFTYTAQLDSFEMSDFGSYTCIATIRPQATSGYVLGVDILSDTLSIKPSKLKIAC